MSDYLKFNSDDSELDAILAEVKNSKQYAEAAEEEPAKEWSMEDIDRLIAAENGEEYVPAPKKEVTPAEDFDRIIFSAGKIGWQIETSAKNLKSVVNFEFADIICK